MEFSPEPQEFSWWEVQGKHGEWRMGDCVTIHGDATTSTIRYGTLGAILFFFGLSLLGVWNLYSDNELSASQFWLAVGVRTVIAIGLFAIGLWYFAGRSVTIDWNKGTIETKRSFVKRRYPLSSLRSITLSKGPSRLVDTSELRLVLENKSVPFVETYHRDKADERDKLLVTLGRRLAETLHVPLQTLGDQAKTLALGMTDQELAQKYVNQGDTMALHSSGAEMKGNTKDAEAYRQEAIYCYQYAQQLDPLNSGALLGMGRISDDNDFRLRAADLAVGEHQDNVDALLERGHTHQLAGNDEAAEADFDRAVEVERSAQTLRARGVSLYFKNRLEDARKDFEGAIELEPDDAELHHWVGECWRRLFQYSRVERHRQNAIVAMNRAVELDAENTTYHANLRKLEHQAGKYSGKSIAELDRLCEQYPDDFWLFKTRGEMYLEQGNAVDQAIDDFSRVIKMMEQQLKPSGETGSDSQCMIAWAYRMRSEARRAAGDLVAADKDIERALELESTSKSS